MKNGSVKCGIISFFSLYRRKAEYQEDQQKQCSRFAPRHWTTCLSSTSSPRTTGCPTRRSGLRRDQCASSSYAGRQRPHRAALQSASRKSAPSHYYPPVASSLTPAYHYFSSRSWKRGGNRKEATEAAWRKLRMRGPDMAVTLESGNDHATWTRPWIIRLRWTNYLMTTQAKYDQVHDTLSYNPTLTTARPRTCCSGDRISDVASSICENPLPDSRGLGLDSTMMRDPSRNARRDDGVCNNCTKCIQLGLMCLIIIISQEDVGRITATFSVPYFHPLSYSLFSGGELEYCLYVKVSLFLQCV